MIEFIFITLITGLMVIDKQPMWKALFVGLISALIFTVAHAIERLAL